MARTAAIDSSRCKPIREGFRHILQPSHDFLTFFEEEPNGTSPGFRLGQQRFTLFQNGPRFVAPVLPNQCLRQGQKRLDPPAALPIAFHKDNSPCDPTNQNGTGSPPPQVNMWVI